MSSNFNQRARLGIVGGGQLGRMLIQSAIDFNIDISVLDPDPHAPCKHLCDQFVVGKLTDFDTLYHFGKSCDILTIEIENVSVPALKQLAEEGKMVYPQPEVIALIQDKRTQKQFYQQHDIPTAEFILVENRAMLSDHVSFLPAVNKLGREGYDGRGVQILKGEPDLAKGFDAPGLLEKFIDFDREISVIVARNGHGEIKTFPPVELSYHPEQNLVEYLFSPAQITAEVKEKAANIAQEIITKLNMIGLLAVEMFVTKTGDVLVNEIAPRPHNSGHQTIEANVTSQYEQHLRSIFNMPLGATEMLVPSAMVNLLGEKGHTGPAYYEGMEKVLATDGTHVHLYGKKLTKPFRKMGHVTITDADNSKLEEKAKFVKDTLKVKAINE